MQKKLLHTPEGVRDIYNSECAKKNVLENKIRKVLNMYGYEDIQTPTFEFFDIFAKERGSVASNEMFKFFDRDGNTMVLRPDMTPSIARTAAKYYEDEVLPLKLCYMGNTFINNSSYQGRLKETTQLGAELIGDDSLSADAEIIAMVVDCLLNSGLTEFQVEIGDVQYFKGFLNKAGIHGELEEDLIELINNKNYFGVEELLTDNNIDKSITETLLALPQLFGSVDVLDKARKLADNKDSDDAITRLYNLYELLMKYGYEKYVTFDLGMLSKHAYYTGVIFNAYTYGTGDSIVKGGRYDKLIGQFGSDKPSIGFSLTLNQLLSALERQKIDVQLNDNGICVLYNDSADIYDAVSLSQKLRLEGFNVNMLCKSANIEFSQYIDKCCASNIGQIYHIISSDEVEITNIIDGTKKTCILGDITGGNN